MFFTETVNYYDHVNRGNFADITDIVKDETLEEFGEEGTILSKMDTAFADYLSVDGRYYGVPFYEGIYGLMYNKQVFLDYGLYYVHSGTLEGDKADTLTFITPKNALGETLSAGPNGELGDYDDGLPATYAQFEELVRHIREDTSVIPFSYGGSVREYPSRAMMTFWADAEGYDQMRLNFTLTGKATDLVESVGGDGTVQTYSDDVLPADAYKLRKQAGQYYALSFLNDIVLGNAGNTGRTAAPISTRRATSSRASSTRTSSMYTPCTLTAAGGRTRRPMPSLPSNSSTAMRLRARTCSSASCPSPSRRRTRWARA